MDDTRNNLNGVVAVITLLYFVTLFLHCCEQTGDATESILAVSAGIGLGVITSYVCKHFYHGWQPHALLLAFTGIGLYASYMDIDSWGYCVVFSVMELELLSETFFAERKYGLLAMTLLSCGLCWISIILITSLGSFAFPAMGINTMLVLWRYIKKLKPDFWPLVLKILIVINLGVAIGCTCLYFDHSYYSILYISTRLKNMSFCSFPAFIIVICIYWLCWKKYSVQGPGKTSGYLFLMGVLFPMLTDLDIWYHAAAAYGWTGVTAALCTITFCFTETEKITSERRRLKNILDDARNYAYEVLKIDEEEIEEDEQGGYVQRK